MTSLQYPSASLNLPQYTGSFSTGWVRVPFTETDLDLTATAWTLNIDQETTASGIPAFKYTIFDGIANSGKLSYGLTGKAKANILFSDWPHFDQNLNMLVIAFAEAINGFVGTLGMLHAQEIACPFAWAKPVGSNLICYGRSNKGLAVTTI